MEFIPPTDKGEKEKPRFIREEDLKGHMRGEPGEGEDTESKREEKEEDERVRLLLERDNQVRHALQLLQTWNIFSQIRTTP